MKKTLLIFALFSVVAHAAAAALNTRELFRTEENLAIVTQPERVEACILYAKNRWLNRGRKYKEGKYLPVAATDAVTLSTVFTAESTYRWDVRKACMPVWNARVKFYRGGQCISADLCFGCDILVLYRNGKGFSGASFDHGSEASSR